MVEAQRGRCHAWLVVTSSVTVKPVFLEGHSTSNSQSNSEKANGGQKRQIKRRDCNGFKRRRSDEEGESTEARRRRRTGQTSTCAPEENVRDNVNHRVGYRAMASTAVLALLASGLPTAAAAGGRCAFTQDCFHNGVDTACIPAPAGGSEPLQSYPMDAAHGFGVVHDKVWDGSVEDPSTGQCLSGGTPDAQGRCIVDFVAPKGLADVAPIVCPQYAEDGCCTWQQNYALYSNLQTLVDSFGSATGCLACAVNLVNFWCALICSPDQGSFITIHDPPFAERMDDLTGGSGRVLQSDVVVDGDLACRIYDSCKNVAIVGETTAMQSGLGLLKFQMQTGAVGHGEYFFLSFSNVSTSTVIGGSEYSGVHGSDSDIGDAATRMAGGIHAHGHVETSLDFETLSCDSFYDPGSSTVPFPYPPKQEELIACRCDYCAAACAGGSSIDVDVGRDRPIPVLDGFGFVLVGSVYTAVAACSVALLWWRRKPQEKEWARNSVRGHQRDFLGQF